SRVDRVLSQWGAPDAYEGDVDALTLSQIPRHGCWVGFRRVDGDHVTECAYCLCAARLRLADDDAAGSGTQSEQRVQHANRSAAKNQHRTPHCHFAPQVTVVHASQGFTQCHDLGGKRVRRLDEVTVTHSRSGNPDVLRHSARNLISEDTRTVTQVRLPAPAGTACAAPDPRHDGPPATE